jgi:hypothetical protein
VPKKPRNSGCICRGNWRKIVKEYEALFGQVFAARDGENFTFTGLVHSDDDYYYLMISTVTGKAELLSCVGDFEGFGYTIRP